MYGEIGAKKAIVKAMCMFDEWEIKPSKFMVASLACELGYKHTMCAEAFSEMMENLNDILAMKKIELDENNCLLYRIERKVKK